MKYIKLLILFVFCYGICNAQPIINRSSSANTVSDARLQGGLNLYVPRYADTSASHAGANIGLDSTGAIIYTYTPNGFWIRKANPKRWVRITDSDVSTTYAAGFGLLLNTNTFSVDSIAMATRGRLYKVVDSSIRANRQGLASVLTVSDDADGRGIYNLSSLFSLDTLNTSGVFQLGYGAYTMSFPRTLTANRTMIVPDANDTLAGRTWVRGLLAGFTPTTPDLQAVTDAGHTTNNDIELSEGNNIIMRPALGYPHAYTITTDGASIDGAVTLKLPNATTGNYYLPISVNGQTSDLNGNITISSSTSDLQAVTDVGNQTTNTIEFTDGDGNVRVRIGNFGGTPDVPRIAFYDASGSLRSLWSDQSFSISTFRINSNTGSSSLSSIATANRSVNLPDADGTLPLSVNGEVADDNGNITIPTGSTYSAGNGLVLTSTTFSLDTVISATRGRLYKTIDSMKVYNAATFLTTATAASTYVPLARTVTPNAPLFGGGALSSNITVSLDTTTVATRAYAQKLRDSMNVLLVHISGTETITGDKTFSGVLTAPTINGSTAANGSITIQGTSNSTRTTSYVNLQPTAGLVGIGTTTPFLGLDINNTVRIRSTNPLYFGGTASAGDWKTNMFSSVSGEHTISANGFLINNAGYGALTFLKGLSTGEIGVGVTAPTARLHLPAGAAAAQGAPLKFTSGTNLTTAEIGGVEFDGTQLYETNSTAVRGIVDVIRNINSSAATLSVTNTYSHYTFTGTTSTWTLPTVSGNTNFVIRIKNIGSGTLTINSNAGATDIYTSTAVSTFTVIPGGVAVLVNNGTYYLSE